MDDLEVSVNDAVKMRDQFGKAQKRVISGVAGTLHLTDEAESAKIVSTAIQLSKSTGKPVVIVVRM